MSQRSITLRQIEYFLMLAKTLNFSRAAENLYTTQSTFSRQIHMMEQELGVKLFHRHSKKVELSSAGAYLQTEFEALLNEIDIIVGNARKLDARYTGTVTVGVTDLEELPGLAKAMQAFRKEYPDAFVKIKVAPFSQLVQDIQNGELDIVCCMRSPAAAIAGFRRTFLRKGHFFCLVPTSSPLASKKELTPQDIEGNTWIFRDLKNSTPIVARLQRELRDMYPDNTILYSASPAQSALLVKAGFGLSIVVGYSVTPSDEHKMIPFVMPPLSGDPNLDLIALWNEQASSAISKEFVKMLSQQQREADRTAQEENETLF